MYDRAAATAEVAAMFACAVTITSLVYVQPMFMPLFQRDFNVSLTEIASVGTASYAAFDLVGGTAAMLTTYHLGAHVAILAGGLIFATAMLATSYSQSLGTVFWCFGFCGGSAAGMATYGVLLHASKVFARRAALAVRGGGGGGTRHWLANAACNESVRRCTMPCRVPGLRPSAITSHPHHPVLPNCVAAWWLTHPPCSLCLTLASLPLSPPLPLPSLHTTTDNP